LIVPFLKIEGLKKNFGAIEVLKNINLEIEEGGFLVLVGPSGCGKSTLLNAIAGLENITSGSISIAGRKVNDLHPSERDIAMVFQSYALYPNMTVAGNISFGMEMRGIGKVEREKAVRDVAGMLQISHLLERKPAHLSGGQRQRVAMGRALVRKPQVFLFDEPLSNLDAKLRVDMRTEIKRLHQRLGTTIVYVTHDQVEAMTLATRIAVLRDGELQQYGDPAEIYNRPANLFVADFMGSPTMNLLDAELVPDGEKLSVRLHRDTAKPIVLPVKGAPDALRGYVGEKIIFGIRPEALTDASGFANAENSVSEKCYVEVVEPTGSDTFAITRIAGKEVVARLGADANVKSGSSVELTFNMAKAVFFDPATTRRIEA
jgi:multiple sugar transport system ATP-binding protein